MSKAVGLRWVVVMAGAMLLILAVACGTEPEIVEVPVEVVVEKEVVKEVPVEVVVEKEVVKEVPVETVMVKEVPVEKIVKEVVEVEKEVVKEVPVEVVVEKEVVKIVEVEKPVVVRQEVVKEVVKEVEKIVLATPQPALKGYLQRAVEANPKHGGVLRLAGPWNTRHFDLHQGAGSHAMAHMYNHVVYKNFSAGLRTLAPDLATDWTISADGRTYNFSIRDGVKFHDGTPLSADDVVASLSRVVFPPEGMTSIRQSLFTFVQDIEALDSLTVRVSLSGPRPFFLNLLADNSMAVYSKNTLDSNDNDLRKLEMPPGTGAYVYQQYRQGEGWTFEANPNYWNVELPYPDGLQLVFAANLPDRGTAVLTGQADATWNSGRGPWEEGLKRPDISVAELSRNSGPNVEFNLDRKPVDDPRVRRAMFLAVDRPLTREIFASIQALRGVGWTMPGLGYNLPADVVATLPGWRAEKDEDVAEAKRLLTAAGFPDGIKGIDFLVPNVSFATEFLALAVQEQLKRLINVELEMRIVERSQLPSEWERGNFTMSYESLGAVLPDPSMFFGPNLRTGGSQNYWNYSNPQVDALLDKIDVETNFAERVQLVRELEAVFDQDPPWIHLGFNLHQAVWFNYVKGTDIANWAIADWGRVDTLWLDK